MRRNNGLMGLSMLGIAACAMMTVGSIHPRIERDRPQRDKDLAPHGPEISRQVRRKMEREAMKRGTRR